MITLQDDNAIALLILLCKKSYGQSWYCYDKEKDMITVGIHAPTGEVAYKISGFYAPYFKGMIELQEPDVLSTSFAGDVTDRLLEWSKTL